MTREEALAKLISVRHHCFVGMREGEPGFREAFLELNRLYVSLRYAKEATKPAARLHQGGRMRRKRLADSGTAGSLSLFA